MQQQESPLLQLLKLCLSGVKFTEIFIELTKHYHWQFLWVAQFPESLLSLCWGGVGGRGTGGGGQEEQGKPATKMLRAKQK